MLCTASSLTRAPKHTHATKYTYTYTLMYACVGKEKETKTTEAMKHAYIIQNSISIIPKSIHHVIYLLNVYKHFQHKPNRCASAFFCNAIFWLISTKHPCCFLCFHNIVKTLTFSRRIYLIFECTKLDVAKRTLPTTQNYTNAQKPYGSLFSNQLKLWVCVWVLLFRVVFENSKISIDFYLQWQFRCTKYVNREQKWQQQKQQIIIIIQKSRRAKIVHGVRITTASTNVLR